MTGTGEISALMAGMGAQVRRAAAVAHDHGPRQIR